LIYTNLFCIIKSRIRKQNAYPKGDQEVREMNERMLIFIEKLYREADKLDSIADGESRHASGIYYGKAEGYREVAQKLVSNFGIPKGSDI
jgi:hypothetical protein